MSSVLLADVPKWKEQARTNCDHHIFPYLAQKHVSKDTVDEWIEKARVRSIAAIMQEIVDHDSLAYDALCDCRCWFPSKLAEYDSTFRRSVLLSLVSISGSKWKTKDVEKWCTRADIVTRAYDWVHQLSDPLGGSIV